jgi:uncharacterized SAM-binding protein YcdF (DUF218 family)
VNALVSHFLSSGGVILVLLAAAIWLWRRPGSPHARRWIIVAAIAYSALGCYAISYATGRLLVAGFRPFTKADMPAGPTAIVVLGSGTFSARDWDNGRFDVPDRASASRVLEAFRVFRITDAAWVIASGGLVTPDDFDQPNGRTMHDALARLGVPASRLLVETASRNTHDEAVIVREMLKTLSVQHVILVTSDIHMRRSLGTFRAQGIAAVPAIARQDLGALPWFAWIVPTEVGIDHASDVWHEMIGLLYYFVRGWYR